MFIDGVSHERNIHAWVRIPNGTTVYKQASLLILPKYKMKFILNTFPSPFDGWRFFRIDEKQLLR